MTLSKSNVRTRLAAIAAHAATPAKIKDRLNRLMDDHAMIGRTPDEVNARIDALLDQTPATLDEIEFGRALGWLLRRWEDLPDS